MARPGRTERNRTARSFGQLTRFHHGINSDEVFGTHTGWRKLSECLPASVLARSEWYNDFVLACGVRDIVGTRLVDTLSHIAIFGLHQQIGRRFGDETALILDQLTPALRSAMLRHLEELGENSDDRFVKTATDGDRYYF